MSQIPDDEVREILDADQMKAWQQATAQGRGMEQFLRRNKFLPEDEPARVIPTGSDLPTAQGERADGRQAGGGEEK